MKNTVLRLLFLMNYILLILYISWYIKEEQISIGGIIPMLISTLMLIDITYITSCNIRDNKVIFLFCGLLALDSWYILLSFGTSPIESMAFTALSPIIWFISIKFIFLFLFQGSGYKFQKSANVLLLAGCIGSIFGLCISDRIFACMYGIQFIVSIFCFLYIVGYHWKRAAFVLKSEWRCILLSISVTAALFLIYYFATIDVPNHISNFGIYLPTFVFFMSIHGIVSKEHSSVPLSTVFNKVQTALVICPSFIALGFIVFMTDGNYGVFLIAINLLFAFIYICNIVLGESLKQGNSKIIKESKYHTALNQLQQEEVLKTEFANFLHDDVLQNLLSVKNMMTKVHRPDIQAIITETLDNLNTHIREEMQDYHPVILKNITIKENYQNLIHAVSQAFHERNITVSFECFDTLFLVEPYNVLIYRLLKELLTNVYKHSDGNRAWIMLTQENGMIELDVSDNGTAHADSLTSADISQHKGISSIIERIHNMEGSIHITDNMPHGIRIQIKLLMKGDVSYQYFVS